MSLPSPFTRLDNLLFSYHTSWEHVRHYILQFPSKTLYPSWSQDEYSTLSNSGTLWFPFLWTAHYITPNQAHACLFHICFLWSKLRFHLSGFIQK
jgi:hypothetical protein